MDSIPSSNTAAELEYNDKLCISCENLNCLSRFQKFRLYLPRFHDQSFATIIEIPFYLSRKFAIGIENLYENCLKMRLRYHDEPLKMTMQLSLQQSRRFILISMDDQRASSIICPEDMLPLKSKYILNNPSASSGSIAVEIVRNVSAAKMSPLIKNCKALLDIECSWLVNLIGCVYLPVENLFMTLMENCSMNLSFLIQEIHLRKDLIDSESICNLALFILAEFLVAIDSLHERSLTHRFLSPKLVYFDVRGHLKLGDMFESLGADRILMEMLENPNLRQPDELELFRKLNQNYLDPEVYHYFVNKEYIEAYYQLDCLSDIFCIGIITIETLSNYNFVSFQTRSDEAGPPLHYSCADSFYLKPETQENLERELTKHCGFISEGFYSLILLMLQPKRDRMRGLRMNVQRHRYSRKSGCEYKLRLELLERHPAFDNLELDSIVFRTSPVLQLLDIIN